jgi:CDGSH-type Zn-finger protein
MIVFTLYTPYTVVGVAEYKLYCDGTHLNNEFKDDKN